MDIAASPARLSLSLDLSSHREAARRRVANCGGNDPNPIAGGDIIDGAHVSRYRAYGTILPISSGRIHDALPVASLAAIRDCEHQARAHRRDSMC